MTINASDINLYASQVMADTTDGGGRKTSTVIVPGVPGNIMPKVSRADSVRGRVNMRKLFVGVDTTTSETYAGSFVVITEPPNNDKIGICLMSTGSPSDTRAAARDRIESYVVAGPEGRMVLYGRQLAGQRAITTYQRVEEPLIEVGSVLCLSKEVASVTTDVQYVRVDDVQHEVRIFTDSGGDFARRVVTMKLSGVLRYEFPGVEMVKRVSDPPREVKVRNTMVADASRYYGIAAVSEAISASALELSVQSIFHQIVPTTRRETAVSQVPNGGAQLIATAADALPERLVGPESMPAGAATYTFGLGRSVFPGSLSIRLQVGASHTTYATDDGAGVIGASSNSFGRQILDGTISYADGIVSLRVAAAEAITAVKAFWTPAVEVGQVAHTKEVPVTLASRGTVVVQTLLPLPALGSAILEYRALGKWYRLRDDGTGALVGDDPQYGTGTVDPVTGNLVATLGALPDVGSSLLSGWASPAHYSKKAGVSTDADTVLRNEFTLSYLPPDPESLQITFQRNAVPATATCNAAGVISGTGVSGVLDASTGLVKLAWTTPPDTETTLEVAYDQEVGTSEPTHAEGSQAVSGTYEVATVANVAPHGLKFTSIPVFLDDPYVVGEPRTIEAADNGSGDVYTLGKQFDFGGRKMIHAGGFKIGTIDYDTGLFEMVISSGTLHVPLSQVFYNPALGGWIQRPDGTAPIYPGNWIWQARTAESSTLTGKEEEVDLADAPLTLDLLATSTSVIVPGSVVFSAMGVEFYERGGVLYHSMLRNLTGTQAGTINYQTGRATFEHYPNNVAVGRSVLSLLTQYGEYTAYKGQFRTAGSPVRPASTVVQVTDVDGETLVATADTNGEFSGEDVEGSVNQDMGVISIRWGEWVTAAGNEGEEWYEAANVVGGNVWKPRMVFPSTLTYSTVVLGNLPLDADLVGLDPTRLPTDGRVPIFRPGDMVLLHNTQTLAVENPAVAGETYAAGRTGLSLIELVGANGTAVDADQYTLDLDAGTVTLEDPFDPGAATQPLQLRHRIEQLIQLSDVQINGQLSLTAAVARAYPEAGTYVSTALEFGDLFARVTSLHDLSTWASWSDTPTGATASAELNVLDYPIVVANEGAVTERWRIHFTNSTNYQLWGETLGLVATGTTSANLEPMNALTGLAYFILDYRAFGAGWGTGNNVRFNTVSASPSFWPIRTVLPGASLTGDDFYLETGGDVD